MHSSKTVVIFATWSNRSVHKQFILFALDQANRGYNTYFISNQNRSGSIENKPSNLHILSWPSKTPKHFRDIYFIIKLFLRIKPNVVITNFSATTLGILASSLFLSNHRITFHHTVLAATNTPWYRISLRRLLLKLNTKSIAVSDQIKDECIKYFNVNKNKLYVLPNSINISNTFLHAKKQNIITCIASLEKWKGVDILINALALINDFIEVNNYKVIIIGDGRLRSELENLSKTNNLTQIVTFLGNKPFNEVQSILEITKIFILPSRFDGHPLAILEAMQYQCAVIASKVGGISSTIKHMETGILFEKENTKDLVEAIIYTINHSKEINCIINNAYNNLLKEYSTDAWIMKLNQIIYGSNENPSSN